MRPCDTPSRPSRSPRRSPSSTACSPPRASAPRARFQAVFDSSPIPVALLDEHRRYASLNDAYCRFLDRSRGELLGHDPLEFTHPDDLGEAVSLSAAVRSGAIDGSPTEPVEKRYLRPDGSEAWGRLHLVPLQSGGAPGYVVAQIEDITASKRAEARLVRQANFDELHRPAEPGPTR